jgi:hypothetical protein
MRPSNANIIFWQRESFASMRGQMLTVSLQNSQRFVRCITSQNCYYLIPKWIAQPPLSCWKPTCLEIEHYCYRLSMDSHPATQIFEYIFCRIGDRSITIHINVFKLKVHPPFSSATKNNFHMPFMRNYYLVTKIWLPHYFCVRKYQRIEEFLRNERKEFLHHAILAVFNAYSMKCKSQNLSIPNSMFLKLSKLSTKHQYQIIIQ